MKEYEFNENKMKSYLRKNGFKAKDEDFEPFKEYLIEFDEYIDEVSKEENIKRKINEGCSTEYAEPYISEDYPDKDIELGVQFVKTIENGKIKIKVDFNDDTYNGYFER